MPSSCWGPVAVPGSPLLLLVSVPCLLALPFLPLGSRSLVARCSALLLRLLMEACHPGAPGAESQRLFVHRTLRPHYCLGSKSASRARSHLASFDVYARLVFLQLLR